MFNWQGDNRHPQLKSTCNFARKSWSMKEQRKSRYFVLDKNFKCLLILLPACIPNCDRYKRPAKRRKSRCIWLPHSSLAPVRRDNQRSTHHLNLYLCRPLSSLFLQLVNFCRRIGIPPLEMRFQDLLAFGLHLASSFASVLRRGQHAAITERQSAPYPANIFNQPVR